MTGFDIFVTFQWWLTLFIIGLGFLPLTTFLFKPFFDRGYLFAKILGLIIISYIIFVFGLSHIISFSTISSYFIFITVSVILFFVFNKKENILQLIKAKWKIFSFEEMLFFATLLFWAYIHSFSPNIDGLEKYMDFGFINSILRSDYFPPKDMWFTPFFINYYYFGHLMTAVLTKLSNLSSNYTFNLMLSSIFAFCFTQSFSIAANLYDSFVGKIKFLKVKRIFAGLISAMLVAFGGNLHIVYAFFKAYPNESPVPLWQLNFLPFSFPNAYWYPNATRFIYHTIHEFPIYSWVVADLHGHVLDIPIVLLTIGILLSFFITKNSTNNSKLDLGHYIFIGFLLAVMYMTNAWDGAIYFLLSSFVIIYLFSRNGINYKKIFSSIFVILLGFVVFVSPFNLNFKPFVDGIGFVCSPDFLIAKQKLGPFLFEADHCQRSPWWQLLMLYGFFYFFVISFIVFMSKIKKTFHVDQFVLLLITLATLLIVIPEFIYIKDIYPTYYRANTMFKLVFQAFILLSLSSGYIMIRLITSIKRKPYAIFYTICAIFLVSLVMLYPYQAINSYYGSLKIYKGLDGTAYLEATYPSDFTAIEWLNKNVKGQPVILEAQGDSYTDYARISTNTGLPTVLGWTVHEWLWRGTYDIPAPRINEVKTMYESSDILSTMNLLKKYNVQYVFIGTLEYQKYPALVENKFNKLGKVVFQKGTTKIYKITSS